MKHIINYALNDFKRVFNVKFVYNPDDIGKYGTCTINGIIYTIVAYSLIRQIEVDRIMEKFSGHPIIVISNRIYQPQRAFLQKNNIIYLEHRGHLFYPLSKLEKTRNKENHYDKQLNKSRIKGDYGSRLRAAILLDKEILNLPVSEIASMLNMGESTIYFFLKQLKLARMISFDKVSKKWSFDTRRFNMKEIMERIFIRGFGKLGKASGCPRVRKTIEKNLHPQSSVVKLRFYDEIENCEDGCTIEDDLLDSGRIIFKPPFNNELCPHLNKLFKLEFIDWFFNAEVDQVCA